MWLQLIGTHWDRKALGSSKEITDPIRNSPPLYFVLKNGRWPVGVAFWHLQVGAKQYRARTNIRFKTVLKKGEVKVLVLVSKIIGFLKRKSLKPGIPDTGGKSGSIVFIVTKLWLFLKHMYLCKYRYSHLSLAILHVQVVLFFCS